MCSDRDKSWPIFIGKSLSKSVKTFCHWISPFHFTLPSYSVLSLILFLSHQIPFLSPPLQLHYEQFLLLPPLRASSYPWFWFLSFWFLINITFSRFNNLIFILQINFLSTHSMFLYQICLTPLPDGMRCCKSDWPGLCLFCCFQPSCAWAFFLFHKCPSFYLFFFCFIITAPPPFIA